MTSQSGVATDLHRNGGRPSVLGLLRTRITAVWLILVIATALQLLFGAEHVIHEVSLTSVIILFVAFFKVRLIGVWFMEVRTCPSRIRAAFEVYCIVMYLASIGMYLLA